MPKINQEEYEVLKEKSSGGYEWIARDESGSCFVFELKPIKDNRYELWEWVGNTNIDKIFDSSLFQFIQWEDSEPYNIQELIEEYEIKELRLAPSGTVIVDSFDESEETEVKSIQDLIDKWENYKNVARTVANPKAIEHADMFINDLNQLDEPDEREQFETAYKDILNRGEFWFDDKRYMVVPKQEELESKIKMLIEAYKQEDGAYSNPENGWISGFVEDLKNLVEEEQKYYVIDKEDNILLIRGYGGIEKADNLKIANSGGGALKLTEQEIKDYDPRYLAFKVPVEEMEE